jgi:hypothetical protein
MFDIYMAALLCKTFQVSESKPVQIIWFHLFECMNAWMLWNIWLPYCMYMYTRDPFEDSNPNNWALNLWLFEYLNSKVELHGAAYKSYLEKKQVRVWMLECLNDLCVYVCISMWGCMLGAGVYKSCALCVCLHMPNPMYTHIYKYIDIYIYIYIYLYICLLYKSVYAGVGSGRLLPEQRASPVRRSYRWRSVRLLYSNVSIVISIQTCKPRLIHRKKNRSIFKDLMKLEAYKGV